MPQHPKRVLRSRVSASSPLPPSNENNSNSRTPRRSVSPRNDSSSHRNTNSTNNTTASTRIPPTDNNNNINSATDESDGSYHVIENRPPPSNEDTIEPPPNINRTNTNPLSQDDVLRTLRALQARVLQYEERHNETQQTIRNLSSRNQVLEDELQIAVN